MKELNVENLKEIVEAVDMQLRVAFVCTSNIIHIPKEYGEVFVQLLTEKIKEDSKTEKDGDE